ncbi:spore cortex biosynthesis protein YabQ [Priestia megaterium]|uniref:spore cortex biosynthesis protein YabQ n=1 Tax=Priestia megaterium TaxID=1404 RepID=UPI002730FFFB|nr:spore cortex biosynthesis protein YabQ [Priestia megaterium]MDP1383715.1 spore cortex biosynthesis protein YabQ [Priestia megaterium]MDP1427866.1 spore cortex biosynthesis protein YabQ [Priestia megaterium]
MSLNIQLYTMLAMVSMGSGLGASLDTYRYFVNRSKSRPWFVFVNDVLFWMVQALLIFYVLFLVNEGELRLYAFLALFCGFAAYQSLFQSLYLKVLTFTVSSVLSLYRGVLTLSNIFLVKPIRFFIHILVVVALGIYQAVHKLLVFCLKLIYVPTRRVLFVFWRMMPKPVKRFLHMGFRYIEGIYNRAKNMIMRIVAWVNTLKNKGDD